MKKIIVLATLLLTAGIANAQQKFKTVWSDKQKYNHSKEGYLASVIGSSDQYVYANYTGGWYGLFWGLHFGYKIVAFDKETMKRTKSVDIKGFRTTPSLKAETKGMELHTTMTKQNNVYVIWTKKNKAEKTTEIYAQQFDKTLKQIGSIKLLYSGKTESTGKNSSVDIIDNPYVKDKFMIVSEVERGKKENISFEYTEVGTSLKVSKVNKVQLPFSTKLDASSITNVGNTSGRTRNRLTGNYVYGNDGLLYISNVVQLDKEERKKLQKNEDYIINYFNVVYPTTNLLVNIPVKPEGKNLFQLRKIYTNEGVSITSFYSDLSIDKYGQDLHGLYYTEFNNLDKKIVQNSFTVFGKETLAKLYANDKEDKKRDGLFSSEKTKESNAQSLTNDYVVEAVEKNSKDELIIFGSRMINYYRTEQRGKYAVSVPMCNKRNVTVFKIKKEGGLVWATNVDRNFTYYDMHDVYDVDVISSANQDTYLVKYASAFELGAQKKNWASAKQKGIFGKAPAKETITIADADGTFKKTVIDNLNTEQKEPEKDYRYSLGEHTFTFGDETYVTTGSMNPQILKRLVMLPATILVAPTRQYLSKGSGYIGRMVVDTESTTK